MAQPENEDHTFIVDAKQSEVLGIPEGTKVDFMELTREQQIQMMHINKDKAP